VEHSYKTITLATLNIEKKNQLLLYMNEMNADNVSIVEISRRKLK
jgi:hypothetical protein